MDQVLTDAAHGGHLGESENGGTMAQKSTLKSMRAVSWLLLLATAALIATGVAKVRHDYFLSAAELIGWAIVPLALTLGFTWPVTCRAKTTRRKACGNWAYGFLFGCRKTAGHFTGKFRAQLGSKYEAKPAGSRRLPENSAVFHQAAPQPKPLKESEPLKVTVEQGLFDKCGFWVGFASGVIAIIQAIVSFVH